MWNGHSWPLDVSSNVEWPFLTARCKQQCAIAIVDHQMSIAMWNCHSWPLDVSSNVNHLTVLHGPSLQTFITQSVICCKCQFQMEGTSAKEGLSTKFELILGLTLASQRSFLWKTNKAFLLYSWGVHLPKYSSLSMLVDWYSRHLYSITQGGPYAKVYFSAKFCLLVVKAYMLYNLYESFYSHCCFCCCSVCYCCPCVII